MRRGECAQRADCAGGEWSGRHQGQRRHILLCRNKSALMWWRQRSHQPDSANFLLDRLRLWRRLGGISIGTAAPPIKDV